MKGPYSQRQTACIAVELREPAIPLAGHHHVITPPKWSLVPQNQRQTEVQGDSRLSAIRRSLAVLWNKHHDGLASVSTTIENPLLGSSTSDEFLPYQDPSSEFSLSFTDQYGSCLEILHYGFNSTVRLHQGRVSSNCDPTDGQLFAVKVYRRNICGLLGLPVNTKPSCSPIAIADLHPHHPNILPITNLLLNKRSQLCLITPYCGGGTLHDLLLRKEPLPAAEIDCLIVQILRALAFLHEQNMAHRDVRLETVLLTQNGAVKLAGFSDEYILRLWTECAATTEPVEEAPDHPPTTWSFSSILSTFSCPRPSQLRPGQPGSSTPSASFPGIRLPYVAPENFLSGLHRWYHDNDEERSKDEDPSPADVWATGIIYLILLTGRLPWRSARPAPQDQQYMAYLRCRQRGEGYPPIDAIGERRRRAVYALLNPNPQKRITAKGTLRSEWGNGITVCETGEEGL